MYKIKPFETLNNTPLMIDNSPIPLFFAGKKYNKGGRINPDFNIPIKDIKTINNITPSNLSSNIFGSLVGLVVPVVTTYLLKKIFDKKKDKDSDNIEEINEIVEDIKDIKNIEDIKEIKEDYTDDLDIEAKSLLNRILGRGILEL